jgi:pSer/pThr/pTyr-binding forkhead associated (FHA) protein
MKIKLKSPCVWDGIDEVLVDRYPFVMGRDRKSDCVLEFVFISRRHCQFIYQDNQVQIQDLESHNGTFLNGRRVGQPVQVKDGDEVTLGPICFQITLIKPLCESTAEMSILSTKDIPNAASV